MTDTQFLELMAKIDSLWMLIFIGFLVVLLGLGWFIGGQR